MVLSQESTYSQWFVLESNPTVRAIKRVIHKIYYS